MERSSSVTVLSRDSKAPGMSKRKRMLAIGAVVALAVIGVAVGVVVSKGSSDSSTASGDGNSTSDSSTSGGGGGSSTSGGTKLPSRNSTSGSDTSSSGNSSTTKITSDPAKAAYTLSAFAIGDWGTTVEKGSCCKKKVYTDLDVIAEDVVAKLMDIQAGAGDVPPKAIVSHGDNFYWGGIVDDEESRFTTTFENKYAGNNIKFIPWVNVMGNHDYGGSSFVCSSKGEFVKCGSTAELLAAIDNKFNWQSKHTSSNNNRWILEDHFYVYTIKDAASGVSIDIFNVDTNDADVHGGSQVCCQCYGYAEGDDADCNNVSGGHKYCAGGDRAAYDACFAKFVAWGKDSRTQLAAKVKASTATWKIVNSHYSPYNHFSDTSMKTWFDLLKGSGVQLWMNGHTHGENHDYSDSVGMHFVENGAGGGIIKESGSGIPSHAKGLVENKWVYNGQEYGFFSLTASKEWLKIQYHTADSKWTMAEDIKAATVGGVATKHCWYIPLDGSVGKSCTTSE